jgi:hypothetical protein
VTAVATHARRVRLVILGIALFSSYAYFYEAGGWNQNTRFDLVRAVVNQHTLTIDAYEYNTGDKAKFDGHFYADKGPGQELSVIPIVALASHLFEAAGKDPTSHFGVVALSYLATVASSAVATALAAVCLAVLATRLFGDESAGTLVAVVFGIGTPAWAYATLFQGHAVATAGLIVAFAAATALPGAPPRRQAALALVVGLAAGWATVTELSSALPAVILTALALWPVRHDRASALRVAGWLALGALACASVLLIYDALAFGNPFHVGYASEEGFPELKTGIFGITAPKPAIAGALLFGAWRGLVPLAPILLLTPVGWWLWWRSQAHRPALVAAILIPLFFLSFNSGYYYWEGGWSDGPRQMAPATIFFVLALAPVWVAAGRALRAGLVALALVGIGITLVSVSVTPQPPSDYKRPLQELWWPAFTEGDLSINNQSFDMKRGNPEDEVRHHPDVHQAWNLGERLGLRGLPSLVPLVAIWALAVGWWLPEGRKRAAAPPP